MKTRNSSELGIHPDMSLKDAAQALMTVSGKGLPATRLVMQDGQLVLYVRKPDIIDRLKMTQMPSRMRREARTLVQFALEKIAEKNNVRKDDVSIVRVIDSIRKNDGRLMENLFLLQFQSTGYGVDF